MLHYLLSLVTSCWQCCFRRYSRQPVAAAGDYDDCIDVVVVVLGSKTVEKACLSCFCSRQSFYLYAASFLMKNYWQIIWWTMLDLL